VEMLFPRVEGKPMVEDDLFEKRSVHPIHERLKPSEQFEKGIHHPSMNQHQPIMIAAGFPESFIDLSLETS
jgi:hypothetical protein